MKIRDFIRVTSVFWLKEQWPKLTSKAFQKQSSVRTRKTSFMTKIFKIRVPKFLNYQRYKYRRSKKRDSQNSGVIWVRCFILFYFMPPFLIAFFEFHWDLTKCSHFFISQTGFYSFFFSLIIIDLVYVQDRKLFDVG